MRLRAKLATLFLGFLLLPILVMSLVAIDYLVASRVDDLATSAELTITQVFELMGPAVAQDPSSLDSALRQNVALRNLIDATQAFGHAVVSVCILAPDGTVILGAQGQGEGKPQPPMRPLADLITGHSIGRVAALILRLWNGGIYEAHRDVSMQNHRVAIISVGVSTDLIVDQVRYFLLGILTTALVIALIAWLAISLLANQILRQLTALRRGFELLAAGNAAELPDGGDDEVGSLATKFNELARQVRATRPQFDTDRTHLYDVVRSLQDAIILLDAETIVLFANAAAKQHFRQDTPAEGTSLDDLLGTNHPLVGLARSTVATGAEAHDVPLALPDGSSVLVSFFRVGDGRIPVGLLMLFRDMAPVTELETALDYSNRLARTGTLISGMAHQLRSPLQGMSMRLELLREEGGERVERHVERLRREIGRVDQAVEAILKFTRPADLKPVDFDLNQLLRELAGRLRNEQITIEFALSPAPVIVHADRGMISEAFTNVMANAAEAMPHGGTLRLFTSLHGKVATVVITDQGPGIPQDRLDRIFHIYYSTKAQGSGLGLPFARRALELNGGKVTLESTVGRGTVCTILLAASIDAQSPDQASNVA